MVIDIYCTGRFIAPSAMGCVFLEGAGDDTVIMGGTFITDAVVSRVRWIGDSWAMEAEGDLLVNQASVQSNGNGVNASWSVDADIAVCRSRVRAGYGGVTQSWQSSRITVAGSAISACFETAASAWGSREMVVEQNVLVGGHGGVHIHESICSAVVDNVLASNARAVATTIWPACAHDGRDCSYDPPTQRVLVDGNTLVAGELPPSDAQRQIFVNP